MGIGRKEYLNTNVSQTHASLNVNRSDHTVLILAMLRKTIDHLTFLVFF